MMNSKYTTVLKNLVDTDYDIGLKDYPIFDEAYRITLNEKIKNHFLYREIGFETPALFKHYLNLTMNEVMPMYNQLYLSEQIEFDPMMSYEVTETNTKNSTGVATGVGDSCNSIVSEGTANTESTDTSTGSTDSTNTNSTVNHTANTDTLLSVHSDTPQALLSQAGIAGDNYASAADRGVNSASSSGDSSGTGTINTDTTNNAVSAVDSTSNNVTTATNHGTNSNNITNMEEYTNYRHGHIGLQNFSSLLLDFRSTFLNIDMQVIKDLESCFMGVY